MIYFSLKAYRKGGREEGQGTCNYPGERGKKMSHWRQRTGIHGRTEVVINESYKTETKINKHNKRTLTKYLCSS